MADEDSDAGSQGEEMDLGTYEGERNGQQERHGNGKAVLPGGDTYEGMYQNGKRNGKGTYRFKKGGYYEGEYLDNLKHGKGTFNYPDGSKYTGNWANNMRNGRGEYHYVNGDVYEGEWQSDLKHGKGVYTSTDGTKHTGTFVQGQRHGPAEIVHTDWTFNGTFVLDEMASVSTYRFPNGVVQEGQSIVPPKKLGDGEDKPDEEIEQPDGEDGPRPVKTVFRPIGITLPA